MAKATVVAVYFAFVFILSVSSQTPSEIKDQVTKINAVAQAYDAFQKALEVSTKDVDHFKNAVQQLLPAIKSLRRIVLFSKIYFDDVDTSHKLDSVKAALHDMNQRYKVLDLGVSQLRDSSDHDHVNVMLNWYKEKRAPTGYVEHYAKLFAESSSPKEYKYYLDGLRLECANSQPQSYFDDRQRSSNHEVSISALSGNNDHRKLMKWVKVIAADSARAMIMEQICLGVKEPAPSQYQSDKDVKNAWGKLTEIFADLKKESERIAQDWDKQLLPDVQDEISRFDVNGDSTAQAKELYNFLSAKYQGIYFGVFVLNAEFTGKTFRGQRVLEVPLGGKTVVIFWLKTSDHDKVRQDKIKAYLESVDCVSPSDAVDFRSATMDEVEEALQSKGATAVYITDGNFASVAYPQVSYAHRKQGCQGVEEWPIKKKWTYSRTIIVGY